MSRNFAAFKSQPNKYQITLPNGASLFSRRTWDKGGKFWQQYQLIKPGASKQQLPLVSGKSSGTQHHLAVLDFDVLAPGFTSYYEMAALFDSPQCVVTASPSGKLKVFVNIKWRDAFPKDAEVLAFLKDAVCPPALWSAVDKKGLWNFYLTEDAANLLSSLSALPFCDVSKPQQFDKYIVSDSSKLIESQRFTYKIANTHVPSRYEEFIARKNRGWQGRESFVKILIASYRLNGASGWGLSQRSIAEQLDVSVGAVSAWFKHFQEAGLLKKVSNRYIVGLEAIRYVAGFELIKDVEAYRQSQKVNNVRALPKAFPKDGEFHQYFLHLAGKYQSWQSFKEVLDTVPNMTYKRYKHAVGIFNCNVRKGNQVSV